jgi:hypothetical protein
MKDSAPEQQGPFLGEDGARQAVLCVNKVSESTIKIRLSIKKFYQKIGKKSISNILHTVHISNGQ